MDTTVDPMTGDILILAGASTTIHRALDTNGDGFPNRLAEGEIMEPTPLLADVLSISASDDGSTLYGFRFQDVEDHTLTVDDTTVVIEDRNGDGFFETVNDLNNFENSIFTPNLVFDAIAGDTSVTTYGSFLAQIQLLLTDASGDPIQVLGSNQAGPDGNLTIDFSTPLQQGDFLVLRDVTNNIESLTNVVGSFTLIFPQFGNGGDLTSDIVLLNTATTGDPVTGTVVLMDPDGDPLEIDFLGGSSQFSIDPLRSVTLRTDGQGALAVGSATVNTSADTVDGVIRFAIPGFGVAGVPASPVLTKALVAVRNEGSIRTALAIRNTDTSEIKVNVQVWVDGIHLETMITIPVGGQIARFVDEIFPGLSGEFSGTALLEGVDGGSFAAIALEQGPSVFTTLPVTRLP